ncbi:MAG TPA: FAD-dependent monooxygenase [Terracidiphilus sp.]|nr:FAD-dependent monooxygenase [Terracidiphilus sp.]
MSSRSVAHLVIGGGPAGSMAAIRLAEAGRPVTLIERERAEHHKVCGEFLSQEAVGYLHRAGVSPMALGAVPISRVRLSAGRHSAGAALPFQALSLSRRVLDAALLQRAADLGCEVIRGVGIERLTADDSMWTAQRSDGEILHAQTVFLASGKHDLHGWSRDKGAQSNMVGFKMHWRLAPRQTQGLRDWMELFLFRGGYGGIALVEDETANLCLVMQRQELRRVGTWQALLAAITDENQRLRTLLQDAEGLWPRPLAISPIPYGYLATQPCGLWRVGDQAVVIPSFTGNGMSIAMHSAHLATQMYLAGENTDAYYRALRAQLRNSVALATRISQAMVNAMGRKFAVPAVSLIPGAMRWIAASTRIPAAALRFDAAV